MSTTQLTRNALFLAVIIIAGFIAIPVPGLPLPIVLQNMIIMMSGFFLGRKNGLLTIATFLLLGFIGMPVFAGGRGGAMIFIGPSAGFLLGYLVSPLVVATLLKKVKTINILSLFVIYFFGSALIIDFLGGILIAVVGNISLLSGWQASAAFIPIDVLKVALAALISNRLYQSKHLGLAELHR